MKKALIYFLILLIIGTMSIVITTAQEDETDIDGFVFNIAAVDDEITAESGLILTSEDALANSMTGWSILIHCSKVENNLYVAKADVIEPEGEVPELSFEQGDIVIAIHSASSDMSEVDLYPNVPQKLAALQVKAGMYFILNNIDLSEKTSNNGTATLSLEPPDNELPDDDPMGEMVEDPGYKLDVTVEETYTPGQTLNVTITMKNIVPETGIGLIHLFLYYDPEKVEPVTVNDGSMNTEMENFLITAPDREKWESISKLEEDENRYDISFATTDAAAHAKEDRSLVMQIPFTVRSDALGEIAFLVPHRETEALDYDLNNIYGNAGMAVSYPAVIEESIEESSSIVPTGDSGEIVIAFICLAALVNIIIITASIKRRKS